MCCPVSSVICAMVRQTAALQLKVVLKNTTQQASTRQRDPPVSTPMRIERSCLWKSQNPRNRRSDVWAGKDGASGSSSFCLTPWMRKSEQNVAPRVRKVAKQLVGVKAWASWYVITGRIHQRKTDTYGAVFVSSFASCVGPLRFFPVILATAITSA